MKNLIGTFKEIFSLSRGQQVEDDKLSLVKSRKAMLKELEHSKQTGNMIGIYSSVLGEGMFIIAVDDIYTDSSEQVIIFKPYDLSGYILQRTDLSITEIRSVWPLHLPYRHSLVSI